MFKSSPSLFFSANQNNNNYKQLSQVLIKQLTERKSVRVVEKKRAAHLGFTKTDLAYCKAAEFSFAEFQKSIDPQEIINSSNQVDIIFRVAMSEKDTVEKLDYLIKSGININGSYVVHHNNTLMHLLLVNERFAAIETLLQVLKKNGIKIDLNSLDSEGKDLLITAVRIGAPVELIKALLTQGNNLNLSHTDQAGKSALYYACLLGQADVVQLLLDKGMDIKLAEKAVQASLEEITNTLMDMEIHPLREKSHILNQFEGLTVEGKHLLANKEIILQEYNYLLTNINIVGKEFIAEQLVAGHSQIKQLFKGVSLNKLNEINIKFTHIDSVMKMFELSQNGNPVAAAEIMNSSPDRISILMLYVCWEVVSKQIPVPSLADAKKLEKFPDRLLELHKIGQSLDKIKELSNTTVLEKCIAGQKAVREEVFVNFGIKTAYAIVTHPQFRPY